MRKFILLLIVGLLIVSCSSKAPKKTENPVDLYVSGVDLMKKKKYDDAIKKFNAIREQYPFDPMALVATVKLGDTYFLKKDYVLSAGTYEDYFKAHPDEENIPYVLFRLGECYEKLSPTPDRDQANTLKGIERITYLRNRYPTNTYAVESAGRLTAFIQKLADRELYVGEFYTRTAQYNAAIMRLEGLLKQYPQSKNIDRTLFYLYDAHRQLGNQVKADEYLQTLRTKYPKSIWARATIRERKTLKIKQVQPPSATGAPDAAKTQTVEPTKVPRPGAAAQTPQPVATPQAPRPVTTPQTPPAAASPLQIPQTDATLAQPAVIPQAPQAGTLLKRPVPTTDIFDAPGPIVLSEAYSSPRLTEADSTPETPQYIERPKRQVNLRPPEQATAPAPAAPVSDAPKTPAAPAPDTTKAAAAPAASAPAAKPDNKLTQTARAAPPAKVSEPAKKPDDKKSLGFLDQKKPIDIVSDTMEGFDKEKYVFFKGNVVAKQDDLYIYSDTMEAFMSADTNEIDRANAKGNVRIIKQNRTATCKEAFFDNVKGEIILKGDAVVTSDKDKVEGDIVTYYVNEDQAVVTSAKPKRAKATVYPQQNK